ncbi:HAD family hydrolase [Pleomorphomonas sp. PLEO]|uniref:HAD family hydrolase n=1 Tax=Pleomorphomonas sp. PLEO TaxID=3239306 RepID=UPI00351E057A
MKEHGGPFSLNPPKLVIFDFDGTLAETEVVAARLISDRLAALGSHQSPADIAATLSGVSRARERELLEDLTGLSLNDTFFDDIYEAWREAMLSGVSPTPGTVEVLEGLTVPFCVASNSSRKDLILRMKSAGIFNLIGSRFFSSHDIGLHKPDPAVFLLAAEAMGVAPADCVVIEDSTTGLEAAHRAGMRCCAFVGAAHQSERMYAALEGCRPDAVLTKMSDLLRLVQGRVTPH